MPFIIRVAKSAGFCFGVRKALDKLLDIKNKTKEPVRTLGPLIHNEQVLKALKNRAVDELAPNENVQGKHVVIRAHGVSPDTRNKLKNRNAEICDATCPKVAQVQAIVKKYSARGCPVVIIGDKGHAEVDGLLGYAGNNGLVVTGPEEAQLLPGGEAVCVVAQTTQDQQVFDDAVSIIRSRYKECFEFNTICDATSERQAETRMLAVQSDVMVVVGGTHSANTRRLADIAAEHCKTVMIQTADDLNSQMFHEVKNVGVTAGASTPAWVIGDVVDKVHSLGWETTSFPGRFAYKLVRTLLNYDLAWVLGFTFLSMLLTYSLAGILNGWIAGAVAITAWLWRFRGKRLSPGMDLGFIGAVSAMALLPLLASSDVSLTLRCSALLYLISVLLVRLLFHDGMNVQADRISGHQTIPVISCDKLVSIVTASSIGVMLVAALLISFQGETLCNTGLILAPLLELICFRYLRKPHWFSVRAGLCFELPVWSTLLIVSLCHFIY